MIINAAQSSVKTVADPNASYETLKPLWNKSRAVCSGERFVKSFDSIVDTLTFKNLLIPFSPSMTQKQYEFYKAEAELPGIAAQFSRMIIGGLLRKKPVIDFPEGLSSDVSDWILNRFGKDDSSLTAFLDQALLEEVQTSRAWVFVDYPQIDNPEELTQSDFNQLKPYPILHKAESVINWRMRSNKFGKTLLDRVVVRGFEEAYDENEFHPTFRDTVWVHELDQEGYYQVRKFVRSDKSSEVPVIVGQQIKKYETEKIIFQEVQVTQPMSNGKRLEIVPAWPLNGSYELVEPLLSAIIDKEIALYNKISRRNHLLYGASTYTPVIISDMTDEDFEEVVSGGLGSWIRLRQGDDARVLDTPTAALADMDRAIAASIEEMAKLGIRMLTPESAQSGVALEIRNAAQTAQLGTLNSKVSATMSQIIAFMVNWKFGLELKASDIKFSLSADLNPSPLGSDWLRLATEWYQQGLIPRSVWLFMLKQNDIISPDYDDLTGQQEITQDSMINLDREANLAYAQQLAQQQLGLTQNEGNQNV